MTLKNSGLLLIDKAIGFSSFSLVRILRKVTGVSKIGHAGTLDPLASGVMILLIGKEFTKQSSTLLTQDKDYWAKIHLGIATETYDKEGEITSQSDRNVTLEEITKALTHFQGNITQIPPMYSAKKFQGKKLYELALKGVTIERKPCPVHVQITLLSYTYPFLELFITCSKGTYIRSIAHDLGQKLGCGAHLHSLIRKRIGPYLLQDCVAQERLTQPDFIWNRHLL